MKRFVDMRCDAGRDPDSPECRKCERRKMIDSIESGILLALLIVIFVIAIVGGIKAVR